MSLLLQVFLNPLGFASEIRNVLVVGVHEPLQISQVLLELFGELQVFLIAPRTAERMELAGKSRRSVGQVLIELLEHLGEEPQFTGINDGLCHDGSGMN